MPTLKEIQDQINALNVSRAYASRPEVAELPRILADDERIENIVQGQYGGWSDTGVIVATDRRLVFVNKSRGLFNKKLSVEDFPYDKITSVQYSAGGNSSSMTIHASGNTASVGGMSPTTARDFGDWVRRKISAPKAASAAAVSSAQSTDPMQRLQQLKAMLDSGLINEAEYNTKRTEILAQM